MRTFLDRQVDGVIVCPDNDSSHAYEELVKARIPIVVTDRLNEDVDVPAVAVDHAGGARVATEHLIEHGRRVFACISGSSETSTAQARATGGHTPLQTPASRSIATRSPSSSSRLRRAGPRREHCWNAAPDIDALFVASDMQAVGALRALADSGRRVGQDVSVVSFDGIRLGDYISSSDHDGAAFEAISTAVVGRLLEGGIEDPQNAYSGMSILPTRLVIRESCGCPPSDAAAHESTYQAHTFPHTPTTHQGAR